MIATPTMHPLRRRGRFYLPSAKAKPPAVLTLHYAAKMLHRAIRVAARDSWLRGSTRKAATRRRLELGRLR